MQVQEMSARGGFGLVAMAIAGSAAVVSIVLFGPTQSPEGPVAHASERMACAQCRMPVGDGAFAAQIQTREGGVLDFDDPGCLFAYEAAHDPDERATWFRAAREERWLSGARACFVHVERTPMGYGLGAVPAGAEGAISIDAARAEATARGGSCGMQGGR